MTNDPAPDSSELDEASQWVQVDSPDPDRSFAFVVALWALGLPFFIGILLFVGMLTVESDNNGLWVLVAGVLLLVVVSAVILWRSRARK